METGVTSSMAQPKSTAAQISVTLHNLKSSIRVFKPYLILNRLIRTVTSIIKSKNAPGI